MSYKQLAQGIGNESAQRAVANACGKNNIALLVPCHRVIRADGKVGRLSLGRSAQTSDFGARVFKALD